MALKKKHPKIRPPAKRGLTRGQMFFLVGFFGFALVATILFLSYPGFKRWRAFRGWSYCHRLVNTTLSPEDKTLLDQSIGMIRAVRKDFPESRFKRLETLHPDAVTHLETLVLDDKEKSLPFIKEKLDPKLVPIAKTRQSALAAYAYMDEKRTVLTKAAMVLDPGRGDQDPEVRATACEILGSFEDKIAFEPLINAHGDAVSSVRASASSALITLIKFKDNIELVPEIVKNAIPAATGDKRTALMDTLVALGEFASHSDPALVPIGQATIKACIQGFESEGETPKACVDIIVRIGGPSTIRHLQEALVGKKGTPWETRTRLTMDSVRDVLVQFKGKSIIPLIETLKDKDATDDVRTRAEDALVKISEFEPTVPRHLVETVQSFSETAAVDSAISALKKIGERALDEIYEGLNTENGVARGKLLKILLESESRPKVIEFFLRGLADRSDRIRMMCEQGFLELKQAAMPTLEQCLKSANSDLRVEGLLLIKELSDFIADPLMRKILRLIHDPHPRIASLSAEIVLKLGARAVPLLLREVRDEGTPLNYVERDIGLIEKITGVKIPEKYKDYTEAEKREIFAKLVQEWIDKNPADAVSVPPPPEPEKKPPEPVPETKPPEPEPEKKPPEPEKKPDGGEPPVE
ncbi:MAG: hypothetical protein AAB215_06655 [Planctomycetota bacterium]